jgi:hypothetical protein
MYPDLRDVELAMRDVSASPGPKPKPEDIFEQVVLGRSFLSEACGRCFNHGRHGFVPVSDTKKIAENFINRAMSDYAFRVAIRMLGVQTKFSKSDKSVLLVKLPPFDRFEEARELWNKHQCDLEKSIAQEKVKYQVTV